MPHHPRQATPRPSGLRRRLAAEDGATAVLFAVVLPVMLALLGLSAEVLALAGAERELQRTADQAALAAAAQVPLANLSSLTATTPRSTILAHLTPPSHDGLADGCAIADHNAGQAPLLQAFADAAPTCGAGTTTVTPQAVHSDVLTEVDRFLAALPGTSLHVTAGGSLTASLTLAAQLGLPTELFALLPAITTPEVRVRTSAHVSTPLRTLLTGEQAPATVPVQAEGTARRVFKNVLLVPVVDVPGCQPTHVTVASTPLVDLLRRTAGDTATAAYLHAQGLLDLSRLDGAVAALLAPASPDPLLPAAPAPTASSLPLVDLIALVGVDAVLGTLRPGAQLVLRADGTVATAPGTDPVVATQVDLLLGGSGLLRTVTPGCRVDLNAAVTPTVATTLDETLRGVRDRLRTLSAVLAPTTHLAAAVEALRVDAVDLLDPGSDAPTAMEVLTAAAQAEEDVLVLTVVATQVPALDAALLPARTLQGMVDQAGRLDVAGVLASTPDLLTSTTTARGLFRARVVS